MMIILITLMEITEVRTKVINVQRSYVLELSTLLGIRKELKILPAIAATIIMAELSSILCQFILPYPLLLL